MGQFRPGSNVAMARSTNMSSLMSPRQQPSVCDESGEYQDTQRELRPSYTTEYRTMHSPLASTQNTVRSVSRELVDRDSASANMATRPLDIGFLTEDQKQARDRHEDSL